jgi:hypothetical protein
VRTEPELPVPHDSRVVLECRAGYQNIGGTSGVCLDGQIVPEGDSPDCVIGRISSVIVYHVSE